MFTVVLFELTGEKSYMGLSDNFENSSSYLLRESIVKSTTSRPFNPCGNNLSIDIMDREVKVTRIYLVSFCVISSFMNLYSLPTPPSKRSAFLLTH